MNKTEALKEILRIIEANGGLKIDQVIKITHCTGLWRVEEIIKEVLS